MESTLFTELTVSEQASVSGGDSSSVRNLTLNLRAVVISAPTFNSSTTSQSAGLSSSISGNTSGSGGITNAIPQSSETQQVGATITTTQG